MCAREKKRKIKEKLRITKRDDGRGQEKEIESRND